MLRAASSRSSTGEAKRDVAEIGQRVLPIRSLQLYGPWRERRRDQHVKLLQEVTNLVFLPLKSR